MKADMKILAVMLFVASFAMSCGSSAENKKDKKKLSYEQYELNRPVKSIDVRTYEASSKFGEVIKGDPTYGNYLAEFDKAGNLIRKTEYFSDGDVYLVHMYKYDEQNNQIEEMSYSWEGELTALLKYEYNDAGKMVKYFRYDEDGNVDFFGENEYEDEYLVRSRSVRYDEDGATDEEEWVFNRDGKMLLESSWYMNGKLVNVYKFSKFEENCVVEGVEYDADGVKLKEFYEESDEHGVKLIKSHDFTDGSESEYRVKRNDRGHIVYIYDSQEEHKETYYEYEYDSKGNWTKQVKLEGVMKKPVEIIEREIKY